MKHIKISKWIIGFLTLSIVFISLLGKIFQFVHLKSIGWNLDSFSPWYVFFIFIGSLAFVSLSFLETIKYKKTMRDPEHIVILILGVSGLLYAFLLTIIKFGGAL